MEIFKRFKLPRIILLIVLAILIVTVIAIPTTANFTGKDSSTGNELIAEEFKFDSKDNNSTDLTKPLFYNIEDVYPGDSNTEFVSLELSSSSAEYWACLNIKLNESSENTITKPESSNSDTSSGVWGGELADYISFLIWADNNFGTVDKYDPTDKMVTSSEDTFVANKFNIFTQEDNNVTFTIADSSKNLFTGYTADPLEGGKTYKLGSAWCFGDLTVDNSETTGLNCSFENNTNANTAQTDGLAGDLQFYIIQSRNKEDFTCDQWVPSEGI